MTPPGPDPTDPDARRNTPRQADPRLPTCPDSAGGRPQPLPPEVCSSGFPLPGVRPAVGAGRGGRLTRQAPFRLWVQGQGDQCIVSSALVGSPPEPPLALAMTALAHPLENLPARHRPGRLDEFRRRRPAKLQRARVLATGGVAAMASWTASAHVSGLPIGAPVIRDFGACEVDPTSTGRWSGPIRAVVNRDRRVGAANI
jgi:hypothetical protein